MSSELFEAYLKEINRAYLAGDATEHTHRPALKTLVEGLGSKMAATNEPKRMTAVGAPDMRVAQRGHRADLTVGYIECKDIGVNLKQAEKGEQLKRYLKSLDNLIFTDYIRFRLYLGGELVETADLAREGQGGRFETSEERIGEVKRLFDRFFDAEPIQVKRAEELAKKMAGIALHLRDVIHKTFDKESEQGPLHGQYEAFKKVLLHDMKEEEFADMYAQTICYGLFAARCHLNDQTVWGTDPYAAHHGVDGKAGEFSRQKAAYLLPKTNPFLRNIFGDIAGPGMDERIAWLVDDLVALLKNARMDLVLKGFGKQTRRTDPVIHFYETFLAAYDPKMREGRGVYYTPEPVVSYIVRSVDWLLKEKFGLKQGLRDNSKIKIQTEAKKEESVHRCLILDPAAGTGTFLDEVIRQIHGKFRSKGAWSAYVKDHLLPRLYGFELMMAPYAICHMKLGLELAETGYDFSSDERLGVYLTNTLEEAEEMSQLQLFTYWLAEEARAANKVKRDLPIMVVLGNPPYSGHSSNTGDWIKGLVKDYYFVDGEPLGEKNPKWLQDDYVKFIRYGQHRIEQTGSGVLAFITNHGYLDNPTFRGMRQQLMKTFSEIYILDLHGNTKKKEVCPDGSLDKNVFDIQQGVSIGIFVKELNSEGEAKVYHADLWGDRKKKYEWLGENTIETTEWNELEIRKPYFIYKKQNIELFSEYEKLIQITDVFQKHTVGFVTARDNLTIANSEEEIYERVLDFVKLDSEEARKKYNLNKDVRDWKVSLAQEDILKDGPDIKKVTKTLYRPFDRKYTYYTGRSRGFICMPRNEVMHNMINDENYGLVFMRQVALEDSYTHFLCVNTTVDNRAFYSNKGIMSIAPLYLYPTEKRQRLFDDEEGVWPAGVDGRVPNLDKRFMEALADRIGCGFVSDGRGTILDQISNSKKQKSGAAGGGLETGHGAQPLEPPRPLRGHPSLSKAGSLTFGPEDVFDYIYGVFHSPAYRARYAEFLKIDFPRVPWPKGREQFVEVARVGGELVRLHLMEAEALEDEGRRPELLGEGELTVEKGYPKYEGGRVYINATQYFSGVREDVWAFQVGGYQVCEKWLKDRRGRTLSYEDVEHYQKVCVALEETIRLMGDGRLEIF